MEFYQEKLRRFRELLRVRGFKVTVANAAVTDGGACPVTIGLPNEVLGQRTLIALPDVHLSDGKGGDVFLAETPLNVERLVAVLRSVDDFMNAETDPVQLVQLGDWYDVWRSRGGDTQEASFAAIDNVPQFQDLLTLDKSLGMAHVIGNHDASFVYALPDRRVADGARFRFGFTLAKSEGRVFALHGHQNDHIEGVPSPTSEQRAVWLGTLVANYVWNEFRTLEDFFDKQGTNIGAFWNWMRSLVGSDRDDPEPNPRRRQSRLEGFAASFVEREHMAALVKIAVQAAAESFPDPNPLELLVVGHSHQPCVGYTPHPTTGKPVIVVDGGSWVHGSAQLVFGAADRVSVFDIVPL